MKQRAVLDTTRLIGIFQDACQGSIKPGKEVAYEALVASTGVFAQLKAGSIETTEQALGAMLRDLIVLADQWGVRLDEAFLHCCANFHWLGDLEAGLRQSQEYALVSNLTDSKAFLSYMASLGRLATQIHGPYTKKFPVREIIGHLVLTINCIAAGKGTTLAQCLATVLPRAPRA